MDSFDYEDKHYQRRKTDLENHLYKTWLVDDSKDVRLYVGYSDGTPAFILKWK